MSEQHPIFTVTALYPSKGQFKNDNGENVDFDNLVVEHFTSFTEKQLKDGAIGTKQAMQKIKGSDNFKLYQDVKLPCQAKFIFDWDFSGKAPKAILKRLEFLK